LQEITKDKFDYSIVNDEVANYLKERISDMRKIVSNNATQIGEQLYLSQQKLADYNNGGAFGKWVEANGISKRSAYNYINRYNAVQNLHSEDDIETFENLSKSLTYDISKPSAPKEAVDAVMSGDITTHKEYKELEKKLKQSEEANKTLDGLLSEKADTINALEQQVKNKPKPEVVEKTITKEVKPDDYEQLKQQAQTVSSLRNKNSELQGEIDKLNGKLSEMNSKGQEYEELQQKIKNLEYKKSGVMKSIDSGAEIISMNKKLKKMFDGEISSVRYRNFFADDPDNSIVDETRELIDTLQAFVDDMNGVLPTNDRKIIEGKFTE